MERPRPTSPSPRRAALALLLLAGACGPAAPTVRDGPLNLVLVSVDTLRADRLPVYGYGRDTAPTVSSLAEEGLVFARAESHSPRTAPSHMTMFTGLLPEAHGVVNFDADGNVALPDGVPTLASLASAAGWRTVAVTGAGNVKAGLGFGRGFERYAEVENAPDAVERIFAQAAAAVDELADEPFLLFVHTYATHDPYLPPPEYVSLWGDPGYAGDIPARWEDLAAAGGQWIDWHAAYWSRVDPSSPADLRRLRDLYDGCIRRVDDRLAGLVRRLQASGAWERTVLVFLSDHGEEFGEHGGFLHETLFEECLHVPLVVRLPDTERLGPLRGRRVEPPVGLVDLAPTLLDVLGITAPQADPARAWLAPGGIVDRGEEDPRTDGALVSQHPRAGLSAAQRDGWKLITGGPGTRPLLFDLTADPGETVDRSAAAPERVAGLLGDLAAARDRARALRRRWGPNPPAVLDEATRRHLRALGYLDGG